MHPSNAELLHSVDLKTLGSRVRAARVAKGWTQTELAGEEISVGYVSRIESGSRRPNLAVLTSLASRLGTPIEQLLQGITASQYDEIRLGLDYAELALESGESVDAERQAQKFLSLALQSSLTDLTCRGRYLYARALEANGDLDGAIIQHEQLVADAPGPMLIAAGIALVRCYKETRRPRARDRGRRASRGSHPRGRAGPVRRGRRLRCQRRGCLHPSRRPPQGRPGLRRRRRAGRRTVVLAGTSGRLLERQLGARSSAATSRPPLPMASRALALLTEGTDARNLARLRAQLGELQLQLDPPEIEEARDQPRAGTGRDGRIQRERGGLALQRCTHRPDTPAVRRPGDRARPGSTGRGSRPARRRNRRRRSRSSSRVSLSPRWAAQSEAHAAYLEAMHVLTGAGADRPVAQLWFELADLFEEAGDFDGAREAYRSAAATTGLTSRRVKARADPGRALGRGAVSSSPDPLGRAGAFASAGAAIPTVVASATMRLATASLMVLFMGTSPWFGAVGFVRENFCLWAKTVTFGHIGKSILC